MTKLKEKIPTETIERMISDYASGLSSTKIARELNLTRSTIVNYLRRHGVTMRPKGRQKKIVQD